MCDFVVTVAGLCALGGRLLALGGWDGSCYLSSVEEYEREENMWSAAPSMREARYAPAVASTHGAVYLVGGWDGGRALSSCEHYSAGSWESLHDMSLARAGTAPVQRSSTHNQVRVVSLATCQKTMN